MSSNISVHGVSFAWPDGTVVFDGIDAVFAAGMTGVVGDNGSGKSTLLRLLVGELEATAGTVVASGRIGYLPQHLVFHPDATVADALGIAEVTAALRRIEAGEIDSHLYEVVGEDWLVEERAVTLLDRLGITGCSVGRTLGSFSGGECMLVGLAGVLLRDPDIVVLDEPTNNLDREHRQLLVDTITAHSGCVIVVSHDRALLTEVDHIAEVAGGDIRILTGDLAHLEAVTEHEQSVADQRVRDARSEHRRQRREYTQALTKLDRRARFGRKMTEQKRRPKVIMNELKRRAQVSDARLRDQHRTDLDAAQDVLDEARTTARRPRNIRLELTDTHVPNDRQVLDLDDVELANGAEISLHLRGPVRLGVVGTNGSGKTTLLRTIAGEIEPRSGTCSPHVPFGYLPQRHEHLYEHLSVADNVRRRSPTRSDNELRALLARLLFRGATADQLVATLSGGERFRAALAPILLADPAPQLLMLDEPTNNLDFTSVDQLISALADYRGALVVVSHDDQLLQRLDVSEVVQL